MSSAPLVIVGDTLLDVDIDGSATRLSPEAPVPVVDVERGWHRPGGAGLAALLAARTHDHVVLVTGIADDAEGRRLADLLTSAGVRLLALPMRGTTVTKTRVRAGGQSLLRIDRGDAVPVPGSLPPGVADVLADAGGICVADYGRGVAALPALRDAVGAAAATTPVVWDPHPRGAEPVRGCRLVTPNDGEAQHFCGADRNPGEVLRQRWGAHAVCVTLGARGARVVDADGARTHIGIPAQAAAGPVRADTCGAGDRFAVAATAALADGADTVAAVTAAVDAAARFVAAGGAAGVSTPAPAAQGSPVADTGRDVSHDAADAVTLAERLRADGRTVVATGGCFDLLHTGHIRLLRTARELGDALIVVINSDDSVRALKGPSRPVMPAEDRARVLTALACVDAVAVFDDATPERILETLRPDVWVKGGDYTVDDLPETAVVTRHGGDVVIVPTVAGYSSSALIAAARSDLTKGES
ncbi:D-glycero-beta-D-manno-heptose 1-phosphate adenylyltransferase [Mycobacterium sp. PSTR-4-N]|uniref:D-glycero-beta-D-manno-heptose 1-phosphate adenylyltransferase n=1 Tax=Mycobacterium sp. PSTR-4-N TaxID=2917745 RepID=UPI001F14F30A|nr:D-glycero-beta-D-manno-heptose 1-phosphate adenylyltransferase [Mycobacterium sp. PSTR-4-N]MCG7596737.1 D-glycero-beta-D-manno-heptose 1-phosphate adenylyltransferase [Mycobacterium sp. PSTR-4-N]